MSRKKTKESNTPQERRREEERDRRREAILRAALTLFARKGYSETTLTEIAAKARLGKATLYYYFPDKESIFWTIYTEETTRYYQDIAQHIMRIEDPMEIARRYILEYVEYGYRNTDFLRLIFPVGKSSPMGGETHQKHMEEVDQVRRPLDIHLNQVLEQTNSLLSGGELNELLWTFLSGLSVKIIQGYAKKDVLHEADILLSMLTLKLGGAKE